MRLIDADAFKAYMRGALEQTRRCYPDGGEWAEAVTEEFCRDIDEQPTVEPVKGRMSDKDDCISRQWLMECVSEGWIKFDTKKDENRFMHLVRDIAPSVQPEQNAQDEDLISRKAAIDAVVDEFKRSPTPVIRAKNRLKDLPAAQPDHNADVSKKVTDEDCISRRVAIELCDWYDNPSLHDDLEKLPSVQPERVCVATVTLTDEQVKEVAEKAKNAVISVIEPETHWIPCSERLPAAPVCRRLITRDDGRGRVTVEEALFSFSRWYDNKYLEDGRNRKFDISASVIAWAPFPAPYRGGDT